VRYVFILRLYDEKYEMKLIRFQFTEYIAQSYVNIRTWYTET